MANLVSYAQNFEDIMLWRALSSVECGFYIDIGAQDPNVDSVSQLFYQHGWRGINVEPTPHYAQLLRIARPDDVLLQVAVSAKAGMLNFYEFPDTGLSTSDQNIAEMHIKNGFHSNEIVVPCVTLDDVFRRRVSGEIHWLKIDVEGSEKHVLEGWLNSPVRPWIVLIESTYPMSQTATHQEWEPLVLAKGYKFAYYDGLSRFYIASGHRDLFKAFSSGPNVFDVMFHGFSLGATTPFCGHLHGQILDLKAKQQSAVEYHQLFEKESAARLSSVEEHAARQLVALEGNYHERETVHQQERVKREQQFTQQLLVKEEELRQLVQERAQRENELHSQIAQTRDELENVLRAFTEREQKEAALALIIQQQAAQQITALTLTHHEREGELLRLQVDREQFFASRHQETTAQTLVIEQQAAQRIAALEHIHRERENAIHLRHSGREKLLTDQLLASAEDSRRLEQERMHREKFHTDQLGRTRHELENLLNASVAREQEIALQMALIEKNYRERQSMLQQQFVAQEQSLTQQLAHLQQELLQLSERRITEIRLEQQENLKLRSSLNEARQNIEQMRGTVTWRATSILRAVGAIFEDKKNRRQENLSNENMNSSKPEANAANSTQVFYGYPATPKQHLPTQFFSAQMDTIMPHPAIPVRALCVCVDQLLALHDDVFISAAFEALLGRAPDPEGARNYLSSLREGDKKSRIISQIASSAEGKRHNSPMRGLRELIAEQKNADHWFWGKFFRAYRIERQVDRIENGLCKLAQEVRESDAASGIFIAKSEQSILQAIQHINDSLDGLTKDVEALRAETKDGFVSINQSALRDQHLIETNLASVAKEVLKLVAETTAINARSVKIESLLSGVNNVGAGAIDLRMPKAATKEYEDAIKPISISRDQLALPRFSIVILQFYKSELTISCVRSVLRNTGLDALEIIVVDNGSSPEHVAILRTEFGDLITIIEIGTNRYFGEGNNIGADRALGEFIIFMNNDIVVTPGWLEKLNAQMKNDADIVGPAFIYPDGRVQECGAYIDAEGRAIQQFKGGSVKDMPHSPFECDYISAATIMLKKETFLKVGGFDLCYEPAYYEDVDLCLKIASYGGKIICVPEVKIFHNENATSSDEALGLNLTNDIIETNKTKFLDRWSKYLFDRVHSPIEQQTVMGSANAPLQFKKTESAAAKSKKALLFSPYPLTPGGGEKYLLTIAQELSKTYSTSIAFEYCYSTSRLRQLESYLNLDLSNVSLIDLAEARDQEWEVAVVLGNSVVPPFPKLSPNSFYICQFPFDRESYLGKPMPFSTEYHYICYSDFVKNYILNGEHIPLKNITILPPVIQHYPACQPKEKVIISVGRFFAGGHCKNQYLLIEAFRRLVEHSQFKDWKLVLIGSTRPEHEHRMYYRQCIDASKNLNVEIIPDASFDVLSAMYAKASLYWHGSGLGVNASTNPEQLEHFGITPLEAASAGCHVFVPDAGGPKEIARKAPGKFHVYSSIEELVGATLKVCANEIVADEQMDHRMAQFINTFSVDMFGRNLANVISRGAVVNTCNYSAVIRPDDNRVRWTGWSYVEYDYKWSNMHESKIEFLWGNDADQQPVFTLQFNTFGAQKIRIHLNGCLVAEKIVSGDLQFLTFEANGLLLGFNSLVFSFPNAHQPGNSDPRVLAIAFRSLSFSEEKI